MIDIDRCFGAPVTDPDGKSASNIAGSLAAPRARTVDVICHCRGYRSTSKREVASTDAFNCAGQQRWTRLVR